MQVTEWHLSYHCTTIDTHTTDRLCYPCRITWEQCIILRCSGKFNQTKLHNEVINKFLNLFLCECAILQISFCININKCRSSSQWHCCTILLLNSSKVTEIQPLDCFFYIRSRLGNVVSIDITQLFQLFQCFNLLWKLFSLSGNIRIHDHSGTIFLSLLILDQTIHSVQSYSSVIANDSSTSVSIRKTGNNVAGTACTHLRCICVKHSIVMSLSVFLEKINDLWIYMITIIFAGLNCHTDTTIRLKWTFKRFICLKTYDLLFILIQISRSMRCNTWDNLSVHVQNSALSTLFSRQFHYLIPQILCSLCRTSQERIITFIWCIILLNKITDINFFLPNSSNKWIPFLFHNFLLKVYFPQSPVLLQSF